MQGLNVNIGYLKALHLFVNLCIETNLLEIILMRMQSIVFATGYLPDF